MPLIMMGLLYIPPLTLFSLNFRASQGQPIRLRIPEELAFLSSFSSTIHQLGIRVDSMIVEVHEMGNIL